jgi:hypothetical protein
MSYLIRGGLAAAAIPVNPPGVLRIPAAGIPYTCCGYSGARSLPSLGMSAFGQDIPLRGCELA